MMHGMHRLIAAGLVGMVCLTSASAQDRRTMVGQVRDRAGETATGVEVRLVHVVTGLEDQEAFDVVDTITDERGRFRAAVLPCARYHAWALGPAAEDGTRPCSTLAWTYGTDLLELELSHDCRPATVELRGIDKWNADGPFQVRWLIGGIELSGLIRPVDDEGRVEMPPMPATRCHGEVIAANGEIFESFSIRPDHRHNRRVRIDPPFELPMRALDENGEPVADVEIWQRIRTGIVTSDPLMPISPERIAMRRLGKTDADGRLRTHVAARKNPLTESESWQQLTFLARKAGHCEAISGFHGKKPFRDGWEIEREGMSELEFIMRPRQPLRGRIVDGGRPCANVDVVLTYEVKVQKENGFSSWTVERRATTDADGRYQIDCPPAELNDCEFVVLPGPATAAMAPQDMRRSTPPQFLVWHPSSFAGEQEHSCDLGKTHRIEVQVLDATGGPARGAAALLLSMTTDKHRYPNRWTPQPLPNSAGRFTMRVDPGRWLLFVRTEETMASAELQVSSDNDYTLELKPMPRMHGTVVDGDGKPIANARLNCHSSSSSWDRKQSKVTAIASIMNWTWIDAVSTDEAGRFACHFLEFPNMRWGVRFEVDGKKSDDFDVIASEDPLTIIIR